MKLPSHISASISHNDHLLAYQTVAEWLQTFTVGPDWESPEMVQAAIASNEVWDLHWYPLTPVAFNHIAAPTFDDLMRFAAKHQ